MINRSYKECPIPNGIRIDSLFTFFKRRYRSDYVFPGEAHDFREVVCILDGKAGITADKNVYMLSAGQLVEHEPNEFHKIWSAGEEMEVAVFTFNASVFPTGVSGVYNMTPDDVSELNDIYRTATSALEFDGKTVTSVRDGMQSIASVLIKRTEIFLLRVLSRGQHSSAANSRSAENYMKIISVMEQSISSPTNAEIIAERCNMSLATLEKTVKKYAGLGAMEYFTDLRIKTAKRLLSTGMSVKETALSVGYPEPNYFSAVFKHKTGITPTAYKRET